ncbi:MAG: hypothetical protein MR316_10320 [Lachnospiraceae bacterium]|nr:hypothetical protein [Lachnospiraceae bacterium]
MTNSKSTIQWHPAFCAALELEFQKDADALEFQREYSLSRKLLLVDLIVIKKENCAMHNNIGAIFRKYNLFEYKSEDAALNVDTYFKTLSYAFLYKSAGDIVDQIDIRSITISFVRARKPIKLFQWFNKNGYTILPRYSGIYYITKDGFPPTQCIILSELSGEEHIFLQALKKTLSQQQVEQFILAATSSSTQKTDDCINAMLAIMLQHNKQLFHNIYQGGNVTMCEALRELFHDELEEREAKGIALGQLKGSIQTLYQYCSLSVPEIAQEVNKPEDFVREVIGELSN